MMESKPDFSFVCRFTTGYSTRAVACDVWMEDKKLRVISFNDGVCVFELEERDNYLARKLLSTSGSLKFNKENSDILKDSLQKIYEEWKIEQLLLG